MSFYKRGFKPNKFDKKTNEQLQSPLFTLPLEIRLNIYNLIVLSCGWGPKIHLLSSKDVVGYLHPTKRRVFTVIPCCSSEVHLDQLGLEKGGLFMESCPNCLGNWGGWKTRKDRGVRWMLSGRKMYEEAIQVLYSSLEFELHHDATWEFLTTVSLANLSYIQRLSFLVVIQHSGKSKLWGVLRKGMNHQEKRVIECCEVVKSLKGLRELRIRIFKHSQHDLNELRILEPLREFQPQGTFIVELPWINQKWRYGDGLINNDKLSGLGGIKSDMVRREERKDNNWQTQRIGDILSAFD